MIQLRSGTLGLASIRTFGSRDRGRCILTSVPAGCCKLADEITVGVPAKRSQSPGQGVGRSAPVGCTGSARQAASSRVWVLCRGS